MVQIQNTDAINAIRDGAKLSISEGFPSNLANTVQPVLDMTPDNHRTIEISRFQTAINATATAIYVTPADQDFYLTNACLSMIKDATATSLTSRITAVINGQTQTLLVIAGITLTADSQTITQSWGQRGIKIDRNTSIFVTNSTNTANVSAAGTIQGYIVNTPA